MKFLFLLVIFVKKGSKGDFKSMVVEDSEEEEEHGKGPKKTPNIGEDIIQLIVLTANVDRVRGLIDEEGAVITVVFTNLKPILDC